MAQEQVEMSGGSSKVPLILGLVIVAAGLIWYFVAGSEGDPSESLSPSPSATVSVSPSATVSPSVSPSASGATKTPTPSASAVKTFNVSGTGFQFNPKLITVQKGDTVKIVFNNTGGQHDFVIDEFNVRTPVINAGATSTVQFVADKTGSFEYYCSVGNHRQLGMEGTLVVQ
jgi:nitrosocyanin